MSLKKAPVGKFGPKTPLAAGSTQPERSVREGFAQPSDRMKKLTVQFDATLHSELKQIAASEGTTMREILERLATDYVDTHRDRLR